MPSILLLVKALYCHLAFWYALFIIIGVSAHIELKGYAIVLSSMTTILTSWIANGSVA